MRHLSLPPTFLTAQVLTAHGHEGKEEPFFLAPTCIFPRFPYLQCRMKFGTRIAVWVACAGVLSLHSLHAGGFQVNLQGVAQSGMAHTGAGLAFDASVQFFNPGGLAFAPSSAVAGITPIFARITYLAPSPDTYTTTNEKTISPPFSAYGSYRYRVNDQHFLALGASVYTPFGSRVLYADDWKGQFALREIALKTIFIQPTLGYAFCKDSKPLLGIGGGPVFATGDVLLRRAMPVQFTDGSYGEATLTAAGQGMGFNVGVMARPVEALTLGLSYRSKLSFKAQDGQATFVVPSALEAYFPSTTFTGAIALPATATVGGAYTFKDKHTLAVDVNYVFWEVYDSLNFDFATNTDKLDDLKSGKHYQNSFIFRAGYQGELLENLFVRGGLIYDMTPVQAGYLTPETPDANKLVVTAGLGYQWKGLRLDACLLWVEGAERYDINLETNFGGTFKGRAFIPGIALGYCFEQRE